MKRIGTITWIRYHNFGSLLQAYALQQMILRLGYQNSILDDSRIKAPYEIPPKDPLKRVYKKILGVIYRIRFHSLLKVEAFSKRKAQEFKKKYLSIDSDIFPLERINEKYECVVCGSDQIWYPNITTSFYYADFFKGKKIAYAPSIGGKEYPQHYYYSTAQPLLEDFYRISLREKNAAQSLSKLMGKEVHHVLDPTLLLAKEDWETIAQEKAKAPNPYVLCYFLSPNQWYLDYAKSFANEKGIELRIFFTNPGFDRIGTPLVEGPDGFLSEIKNSSWVLTDSYHASIFSIIFEKPFVTFQRFGENRKSNPDSRVLNLLEPLGLTERYIDREHLDQIASLHAINLTVVKEKLEPLRKMSIEYLKEALAN